jgi:hypothetical protein
MCKGLLTIAGIAVSLLWTPVANAATITIGLELNGGGINTVAGAPNAASFVGNFGTFSYVQVHAAGNPPLPNPELLNSNTLDVSSHTPGTLEIYVTASDIASPTGLLNFISGFTQNLMTAGWSVTEETFLDPNNGIFTTVQLLGSALFNNIGHVDTASTAATGSGPYSLTQVYTIVAAGLGSTNSTINLSGTVVPLPAALPLFASGLFGLWAWGRRRKSQSAKVA